MRRADAFFGTNLLLYVLSEHPAKADRAEELLAGGGTISVQVLNEFTAVARRKLAMPWPEIAEVLGLVRTGCAVRALTIQVHDSALLLVQRHALGWFDALIVAAALDAGCTTLYSEDMQHGLRIAGAMTVRNPFA